MFKPFAKQSQGWEQRAMELRGMLRLRASDRLNPLLLAPAVGLLVVDANDICSLLEGETAVQILERGKEAWSGGVFAKPLPSGERICIVNPTHGEHRKKITLMEEIAHIHLKHSPSGLRIVGDGLRMRDFNEKQEREAYGVGSAGLLPWAVFFHDLNAGLSMAELADKYEVSEQLIAYRIKTTGAYKLYEARRRAAWPDACWSSV